MSQHDVTPGEALLRLGASTAEAVARVLESVLPGQIERGEVTVQPDASAPFADLPPGAVAASVSYVDGVSGANVFVMEPHAARAMASAMGAAPPDDDDASDADRVIALSELEMSAVAEAANQMMAATASAISVVLGQDIEISPPDIRVVQSPAEASERFGSAPHATSTTFTIAGKTCRLIQLVPSTFVLRMARALDEQGEQPRGAGRNAAHPDPLNGGAAGDSTVGLQEALSEIRLRVWTELGRARMPLGHALALPLGAVVDLDCSADSPVEVYVNGLRFAQGHLLVTDDGEWAVGLDTIGAHRPGQRVSPGAQILSKGAVS